MCQSPSFDYEIEDMLKAEQEQVLHQWIKDRLASYRINGGTAASVQAECAEEVQAILDGAQWDGHFVIKAAEKEVKK
jgi:hypothetical protein